MAAVFARTLKNKFTNTVVPDEAAPQALPKYENCIRKKTNGKYLHESNKNYKIKHKCLVQTHVDQYVQYVNIECACWNFDSHFNLLNTK